MGGQWTVKMSAGNDVVIALYISAVHLVRRAVHAREQAPYLAHERVRAPPHTSWPASTPHVSMPRGGVIVFASAIFVNSGTSERGMSINLLNKEEGGSAGRRARRDDATVDGDHREQKRRECTSATKQQQFFCVCQDSHAVMPARKPTSLVQCQRQSSEAPQRRYHRAAVPRR